MRINEKNRQINGSIPTFNRDKAMLLITNMLLAGSKEFRPLNSCCRLAGSFSAPEFGAADEQRGIQPLNWVLQASREYLSP
jgi:hypothetical protein